MQHLTKSIVSNYLQTALSVARTGSPSLSAKQLELSMTTVYRQLDALELSIGAPIFDRHRTGWKLRQEAHVLLSTGSHIERLLAQVEGELRDVAGAKGGKLRIALSDDIANAYLVKHLGKFCAQNTSITPELITSSHFADLLQGEADVAIRPDMDPGDTLVGQRVGHITHAFYASNAYLDRYGCPETIADLNAHRICGYGQPLKQYTAAQWLNQHVESKAITALFGDTPTMWRAGEEGLGICLLPCFVGDTLALLRPVLPVENGLPVDIWLVTSPTNRKMQKVQTFFDFFAAAFRADSDLLSGQLYT